MRFFLLLLPLFLWGEVVLYQLQNFEPKKVLQTPFTLCIVSAFKDTKLQIPYDKEDIDALHKEGKKLLAYLSIGEAGSYEAYFQESWITDGKPTKDAPSWLGNENPNWPGDYKVRYWEADWFEHYLKPYIDKIVTMGFDGLYLDIVDGYEYWADRDNYKLYGGVEDLEENDPIDDEAEAAKRMIALVAKISAYTKSKKRMLIFPQNALNIIKYDTNSTYIQAIDGVGVESLFYTRAKKNSYQFRLNLIKKYRKAGKKIVVTDYVDDGSGFVGENRKRILDFIHLTLSNNLNPYVAKKDQMLDSIDEIACNIGWHLDIYRDDFFYGFHQGLPIGREVSYRGIDINGLKLFLERFDDPFLQRLSGYYKKSSFLSAWLTKDWQEDWLDLAKAQRYLDANGTLIVHYWYFGDGLDSKALEEQKEAYVENVRKLSSFLQALQGRVIVVFEPECNKASVIDNNETLILFASLLQEAITIFKVKNPNKIAALGIMDTGARSALQKGRGYTRASLGDAVEWQKATKILDLLAPSIDSIIFNQNISQFNKDPFSYPSDKLIAHSKEELGIIDLVTRIKNFGSFFNKRYCMPLLMSYTTFVENCWQDRDGDEKFDEEEFIPNCWLDEKVRYYYTLKKRASELLDVGIVGFAPMELFDDPNHDKEGYRFFSKNEEFIGLIDKDFHPKSIDSISILDLLFSPKPYLFLQEGWNLVGLAKATNIDSFLVWGYENGKWWVNRKTDMFGYLSNISPKLGYWVLSDKAHLLDFDANVSSCEGDGWRLCSHLKNMPDCIIAWKYERGWKYQGEYNLSFDRFERVYLDEGVWIR